MSSVLLMTQRDAVHMVTDAASYHPDGVVYSIRNKVRTLPQLKAAIYCRGPHQSAELATAAIEDRYSGFDELASDLGTFARDFYAGNADYFATQDAPELEIFIAGWSEAQRAPCAYLVRCFDADDLPDWLKQDSAYSAPPYEPQKIGSLAGTPPITPDDLKAAKFPLGRDVSAFDPVVDGLHLFEIQRRKQTSRPDVEPYFNVGGFALLTTITRDEIRQRVLKRYPDRIGEMIEPEPIDWSELAKTKRAKRGWL